MTSQALKTLLASPIAFHRIFATIAGGALPGLFLSQCFYWSTRTADAEGWFYKSREEWTEETGMTRYEQETARRILGEGEKGVCVLQEMQRGGTDRRVFYRINFDRLSELVEATCKTNPSNGRKPTVPLVGKPPMEKGETNPSNGRKPTVVNKEAENTTENTSKNTKEKSAPVALEDNANMEAEASSSSHFDVVSDQEKDAETNTENGLRKPNAYKPRGRASTTREERAAIEGLFRAFEAKYKAALLGPPLNEKDEISKHLEVLLAASKAGKTSDDMARATTAAAKAYANTDFAVTVASVCRNFLYKPTRPRTVPLEEPESPRRITNAERFRQMAENGGMPEL